MRHFECKAVAARDAAAVSIGAMVHVGVQELFDQVAVGGVQFDAVEPGFDGEARRLRIFGHGCSNVGFGHGARHTVRLHAADIGVHLARADLGRRADYFGAGRQVGDVGDAPGVHELHEDFSTFGVNRIDDLFPALHLGLVEQAGDARIAQAVG